MKLSVFELLAVAILVILNFATAAEQVDGGICEKIVDLSNALKSLKKVQCDKQISLNGARSTTVLLRSLVCQCKGTTYVPRSNSCVQKYNDAIITPMIQQAFSAIIEKIHDKMSSTKATQKQKCEAIQIFIDNMLNVSNACVVCALTYRDRNNGTSAAQMTDTCYENAKTEMIQDYLRYQIKVPGSALPSLMAVQEGLSKVNAVYYSPEFRKCFAKFGGQNVDLCSCNKKN